jgi:hypothetical protein
VRLDKVGSVSPGCSGKVDGVDGIREEEAYCETIGASCTAEVEGV